MGLRRSRGNTSGTGEDSGTAGRGSSWLRDVGRDLRYGGRQLRGAPGFALTAAFTLALGIGVSTALFSVVYGVWIDAYPYRDFRGILFPRAFAHNGNFADSQNGVFVQRELLQMAGVPAVSEIAAYTLGSGYVNVMGLHGPESVHVFHVTGKTFDFLGVAPLHGRPILPSDIGPGGDAAPVLVLSFNLWRRMFDGDPSVVGRTLHLSGEPHLVVGVMPQRFGWGSATWPTNDGIWLPLATTDADARLRGWVRLREGVSWDVASEQFQALFLELAKVRPGSFPEQSFYTYLQRFEGGVGGTARYVREMRSSLRFLLYAVGFLLLIACTNVANLQLARGSARSREVAIRLAVGASRWRIVRQLLTENVVLALGAGVLGVALAIGLTRLIVALIPQGYVPSEAVIGTNVPVLLFAVAIAALSGVLFGMFPAIHGSKSDLNETLKDSGLGGGGVRGLRTRNLLVVVEIALSVLLVMGASLAVRGYLTLERPDPGLDPDRLARFSIGFASRMNSRPLTPEEARTVRAAPFSPDHNRYLQDLLPRLRRAPAIAAVALQQAASPRRFQIAGETTAGDARIAVQAVSGGYAAALGVPLVRGRDLSEADMAGPGTAALINEAASRLWTAGRNPIGAHVTLDLLRPTGVPMEVTVVGIVRDASGDEKPQPTVLVPFTTAISVSQPTLYVRTHQGNPLGQANVIRAESFALNPDAVLQNPQDLAMVHSAGRLQPRFNMALFGALAAIALALAAAGVYAVLSYQVARQRRDIGIRLALGAGAGRIIRTVLGLGARLVGVGIVLGIAASVGLGRFVTSQVFTVPKLDLAAGVVAVVILSAVAGLACYVPARRATRVNPLRVLRSD